MLITKFDPDLDQGHPVSIYIYEKKKKKKKAARQTTRFHPFLKGYRDPEYRKRRAFIAELAFRYKQ